MGKRSSKGELRRTAFDVVEQITYAEETTHRMEKVVKDMERTIAETRKTLKESQGALKNREH